MRDYLVTIEIKARPEVVWSVLADVCRWPDWTPTIERVVELGKAPLGLGSKFWIKQPNLKAAVWTINDWTPNTGFTWVTRNPGITVTAKHTLLPIPDGTRVALYISFRGCFGFIAGILGGKMTLRYLQLESLGLKQVSEQF